MPQPILRSLHVYPLKSVQGDTLAEAAVQPWGLAGDRRWMLVDAEGRPVTQRPQPRLALVRARAEDGGAIALTAPGQEPLTVSVPDPVRTMPVEVWQDKVEAVPADETAQAWFRAYLDAEVTLVHLDDPAVRRPIDPGFALPGETVTFADEFPLLLTTVSSLDALNSLIAQGDHADEGPLPMNRFRPNAVVEGTAPWAEDGWSRIAIGDVAFRVAKPCGRCVVTTTDQATGERGKEPLRTLARHRKQGSQLLFGQNLVPEQPGTVRVGDVVRILD
ncbi:MOSC domain-containing protein [Streptomyces sp. T-3]|nr:MOSC domain-containing protein [Streptomyces sp. T-3]